MFDSVFASCSILVCVLFPSWVSALLASFLYLLLVSFITLQNITKMIEDPNVKETGSIKPYKLTRKFTPNEFCFFSGQFQKISSISEIKE